MRDRLLAGETAAVVVLHGMGGVGKTQLAAEYAHRFAAAYGLAWWINAEQSGLIGGQVAALGLALGRIRAGAGAEVARAAVLAELRARGRWLLVFDNAGSPAEVTPWLPGGGHVLITPPGERGWTEIAAPIEVDVLTRAESVAILQHRITGLGEAEADRLAAALGDLPLALAQAAGFMAGTGTSAQEYLGLLQSRAGLLLDQAILRDRLTPGQAAATRARTEALLAASDPGDPLDPATWPRWGRLMPHLHAASLAATDSPGLRQLACRASR